MSFRISSTAAKWAFTSEDTLTPLKGVRGEGVRGDAVPRIPPSETKLEATAAAESFHGADGVNPAGRVVSVEVTCKVSNADIDDAMVGPSSDSLLRVESISLNTC
jgi:hypothetical protein